MDQKKEFLRSKGVEIDTAIQNMIDIETYNDILNDFYEALPGELEKINKFKNEGDMQNYAILVHALKSNARSFGFMKLGDISYNHEMAGKASDINYVNNNYGELLNAIKEVYEIITKYKSM